MSALTALFIAVAAVVFAAVVWNMLSPIAGDKSASMLYGARNAVIYALPPGLLPDDVMAAVDPLLPLQQRQQPRQLAVAYDAASGEPCNCVVFRFDDVQDNFAREAQLQVMDLFMRKGQPVSLGVIAGHYGDDPHVTNKVMEGARAGLFEIALHGWDHVDHSALSREEQADALRRSNEKIKGIFGSPSGVFIATYNRFNNDTLAAIGDLGGSIKVISSSTFEDRDEGSYFRADGGEMENELQMPYRIPATAAFRDKDDAGGGTYARIPVEKILADIDASVGKYGYAVVMMHPQDFLAVDGEGRYTRAVDQGELGDLERLIDSVGARGLEATTFYGLYGGIQ